MVFSRKWSGLKFVATEVLLITVGDHVKTHKITPSVFVGNKHGDIEINDDVVLPRGQDDYLSEVVSSPVDFGLHMTHVHYGRSQVY